MKKSKGIVCGIMAIACAIGMSACGGEKNIMAIARTSGSGTKDAFEEIVKKDGVKLKDATLLSNVEQAGDTGIVISKVQTNKTAIGYVSFSSLDDTVKALKIGGVAPTVENVQNGTYGMTRPFILMTPTERTLTEAAQDFYDFCMSSDSKDQIASAGCIEADREYVAYNTTAGTLTGAIKVSGSSSMEDLMKALIGEYAKVQPNVTITLSSEGSATGRSAVESDTTGNTIGLASSSKASDKYEEHTLCIDAIAVIVNKENTMEDIGVEQLFDIYTGVITKFSEIAG